jgi:ubiquitin C-terminal hydrolase
LKEKDRPAAYEEYNDAPYYDDEPEDANAGKKKGKVKELKGSKRHVVRKWVSNSHFSMPGLYLGILCCQLKSWAKKVNEQNKCEACKKIHKGIVAPCAFKLTVSKFNRQWEGFDQEDSQEMLVDLMDKLHEDLNRCLL